MDQLLDKAPIRNQHIGSIRSDENEEIMRRLYAKIIGKRKDLPLMTTL